MALPRVTETTILITRVPGLTSWRLWMNSHLWISRITANSSSVRPVDGKLVVSVCGPDWCNAELDARRSCDAHLTREIFRDVSFRSLASGNVVEIYLPFRVKKMSFCPAAVSLAKRVIWDLCHVKDNDMDIRVTQETKVLSDVGAWIPYGTYLRNTSAIYGLST